MNPNNTSTDPAEISNQRETLNALISHYGFKGMIEEVRNYALQSERELGLPEKLTNYWTQVAGLLEQILEIEEVEDYEPTN